MPFVPRPRVSGEPGSCAVRSLCDRRGWFAPAPAYVGPAVRVSPRVGTSGRATPRGVEGAHGFATATPSLASPRASDYHAAHHTDTGEGTTMRYQHVAVLAAAAVGFAPAAALATAPGKNGQIAFRRYLGPDRTKGAIFVAAPDGSGERQLTPPPANAGDDYPDVAPDGSFVAFQRCGATCGIYAVHPDGTRTRRVRAARRRRRRAPTTPTRRSRPTARRSRSSARSGRSYATTRSPTTASTGCASTASHCGASRCPEHEAAEDVDPQWSPDGQQIVFVRHNVTASPGHAGRLHRQRRRHRRSPRHAVQAQGRRRPRLVARRLADPVPQPGDRGLPGLRHLDDPSRRDRPAGHPRRPDRPRSTRRRSRPTAPPSPSA